MPKVEMSKAKEDSRMTEWVEVEFVWLPKRAPY